jgi:hypothetical protein
MKRPAPALAAVLTAALLASGCGGGSGSGTTATEPGETTAKPATAPNAPAGSEVVDCTEDGLGPEQLRATAVSCDVARATMTEWENDPVCEHGGGGARSACSIGDFRCQAVKVEAGTSVSCERKGGAVSWLVRPVG